MPNEQPQSNPESNAPRPVEELSQVENGELIAFPVEGDTRTVQMVKVYNEPGARIDRENDPWLDKVGSDHPKVHTIIATTESGRKLFFKQFPGRDILTEVVTTHGHTIVNPEPMPMGWSPPITVGRNHYYSPDEPIIQVIEDVGQASGPPSDVKLFENQFEDLEQHVIDRIRGRQNLPPEQSFGGRKFMAWKARQGENQGTDYKTASVFHNGRVVTLRNGKSMAERKARNMISTYSVDMSDEEAVKQAVAASYEDGYWEIQAELLAARWKGMPMHKKIIGRLRGKGPLTAEELSNPSSGETPSASDPARLAVRAWAAEKAKKGGEIGAHIATNVGRVAVRGFSSTFDAGAKVATGSGRQVKRVGNYYWDIYKKDRDPMEMYPEYKIYSAHLDELADELVVNSNRKFKTIDGKNWTKRQTKAIHKKFIAYDKTPENSYTEAYAEWASIKANPKSKPTEIAGAEARLLTAVKNVYKNDAPESVKTEPVTEKLPALSENSIDEKASKKTRARNVFKNAGDAYFAAAADLAHIKTNPNSTPAELNAAEVKVKNAHEEMLRTDMRNAEDLNF